MPAKRSTKSSTARRSEAYVDTSALIAFADRSDTYHPLFLAYLATLPRCAQRHWLWLKVTAGS
jgi:hypothetical protein